MNEDESAETQTVVDDIDLKSDSNTPDISIPIYEPAENFEPPPPRLAYNFQHPKRDLVFLPGTGGNFFATMIYDKVHNMYVGTFKYDDKINEYAVSQSMSHLCINGQAKSDICTEIKKIPLRLQLMINYIKDLQDCRGISTFDWIVAELKTVMSVAHRLTIPDLSYVAFSDFLISKNDSSFSLDDEERMMGKAKVGEFYDNMHDLFYQHYNAHAFPYMTDICHVPYHINTFKDNKLKITNYGYANIIAHEQALYTELLMRTKHLLRNDDVTSCNVESIRNFISDFTSNKYVMYQYVTDKIHSEMLLTGINSEYSKPFFYEEMIINPNEDKWGEFYEYYGYGSHFWTNKNRLMDKVHAYHEKNIKLLLNFVTQREINHLMYPYQSIKTMK